MLFGPLESLLMKSSEEIPLLHVVKIARDIFSALAYLHEKKVVHGNIAPENIFITQNGNFKIGNFVLSKKPGKKTSEKAKMYGAPEFLETGLFSEKADIWSAGAVLTRIILRKFEGDPVPIGIEHGKKAAQKFPEIEKIIQFTLVESPEKRMSASELPSLLPQVNQSIIIPYWRRANHDAIAT
jgi:serine/threonine protein kinase